MYVYIYRSYRGQTVGGMPPSHACANRPLLSCATLLRKRALEQKIYNNKRRTNAGFHLFINQLAARESIYRATRTNSDNLVREMCSSLCYIHILRCSSDVQYVQYEEFRRMYSAEQKFLSEFASACEDNSDCRLYCKTLCSRRIKKISINSPRLDILHMIHELALFTHNSSCMIKSYFCIFESAAHSQQRNIIFFFSCAKKKSSICCCTCSCRSGDFGLY